MTCPDLSAAIAGIYLGAVQAHWPGKPPSAIAKQRAEGRHRVTELGIKGDAQADLTVHGGPDKAIHHYAFDHYAAWQAEGCVAAGTQAAAFGENLSSLGLTEDNLCIGDILRLGSAVVQISQGRQPCWKLGLHCDNARMPYLFQKTGRTGWYYRVLEEGHLAAGDPITLIERRHPRWSVYTVTRARLTRRVPPQQAAELSRLPDLAAGWRQAFARMAEGALDEDTSARLGR